MNRIVQCVAARTVAVVLSLVCATALAAQTTTGSIRGYVRGDNGVPIPNASVSARNIATSATRVASSNENGYFALVGLAPGDYDVTARRLGAEPQTRRQRVQIGETITLNFDLTAIATQLAAVQVTAPRETQSSEVATNVSAEQISALPSTDRNFLALAQLALGNTELVVLSACETGLGDVKGAEGVFGLQRSFKMAGVKNMIVSLWQVPDKETIELMTAFYSNRLGGKSTRESFNLAQGEMRRKYPPFYWAAFVLVE